MPKHFIWGALILLILADFIIGNELVYCLSKKSLEIKFFKVQEGSAIFIKTPQGEKILINGGGTREILEKIKKEMRFWERKIDLIILTNPNHNYFGGLIEILKRYKVKNVILGGILKDTNEYQEWEQILKKAVPNIFIAQKNLKIKGRDVKIDFLFPPESLEGKFFKTQTNATVVFKLNFKNNSFLFLSDASPKIQKEILKENEYLKVNLVAIDEGKKKQVLEEFFINLNPDLVVFNVSQKNQDKYPDSNILDFLSKNGINILRTDLNGNIKIISNGTKLKYELSTF